MNLMYLLNPFNWFKQETKKKKRKVFLTKEQVDIAYKMYKTEDLSIVELAKIFNISKPTATSIINGEHRHQVTTLAEPPEEEKQELIPVIRKSRKPVVRKKTNNHHLSKNEVSEIEAMYPNIDRKAIISTYDISRSTFNRVLKGTHTKSSETYKTKLLKANLK